MLAHRRRPPHRCAHGTVPRGRGSIEGHDRRDFCRPLEHCHRSIIPVVPWGRYQSLPGNQRAKNKSSQDWTGPGLHEARGTSCPVRPSTSFNALRRSKRRSRRVTAAPSPHPIQAGVLLSGPYVFLGSALRTSTSGHRARSEKCPTSKCVFNHVRSAAAGAAHVPRNGPRSGVPSKTPRDSERPSPWPDRRTKARKLGPWAASAIIRGISGIRRVFWSTRLDLQNSLPEAMS